MRKWLRSVVARCSVCSPQTKGRGSNRRAIRTQAHHNLPARARKCSGCKIEQIGFEANRGRLRIGAGSYGNETGPSRVAQRKPGSSPFETLSQSTASDPKGGLRTFAAIANLRNVIQEADFQQIVKSRFLSALQTTAASENRQFLRSGSSGANCYKAVIHTCCSMECQ